MQSKARNISAVVQEGWCTGCGTCVAFCPEEGLEIEYTVDGRYVPKVIDDKCTGCGLCVSLCPAANENFKELNRFIFGKIPDNKLLGNYINCFTGHAKNASVRWKATSGGVITSLLLFLLKEKQIDGALLTRINEEDPLKAEPFVARTEEEILAAMGSKYVPIPLNRLLDQILAEEGKFAVVGLPCHLQGIRRAEMKNNRLRDKIHYHLGLICSRTMSIHGTKFILRKIGVSPDRVSGLKYRGEGWPSGMRVLLKSGKQKYLPMLNTWWSEIFGGYFFSNYYCTLCTDLFAEMSDISFADAYLPKFQKSDKRGTSIVLTRTPKGEELIQAAILSNQVVMSPVSSKDVLRSQLFMTLFKKRNITARIKYLEMFGKKLPQNINKNLDIFLPPTLWDYFVAPVPYINIFISKNKYLKRILKYIPFIVLVFYRIIFKQLLVYKKKTD